MIHNNFELTKSEKKLSLSSFGKLKKKNSSYHLNYFQNNSKNKRISSYNSEKRFNSSYNHNSDISRISSFKEFLKKKLKHQKSLKTNKEKKIINPYENLFKFWTPKELSINSEKKI